MNAELLKGYNSVILAILNIQAWLFLFLDLFYSNNLWSFTCIFQKNKTKQNKKTRCKWTDRPQNYSVSRKRGIIGCKASEAVVEAGVWCSDRLFISMKVAVSLKKRRSEWSSIRNTVFFCLWSLNNDNLYWRPRNTALHTHKLSSPRLWTQSYQRFSFVSLN